MSLRFIDGMGHYATQDIGSKWDSFLNVTIQPTGGRFGGGSMFSAGFRSIGNFQKTFDNQASWVIGMAIKHNGFNAGANNSKQTLIQLYDGPNTQIALVLYANGQLGVEVNGAALASGVSTVTLSQGVWHYLEWAVTISNSILANQCQVQLDGVQIINVATGQSTQHTANSSANSIQFIGLYSATNWDDIYILDGNGTPNAFFGDQRVFEQYPNGVGFVTQWTPNGFVNNWQNVSETPADDDATYNSTNTVNNQDLYTLGATGATGTINGVQVTAMCRKDDAGARAVATLIRTGATNFTGATVALLTNYICLRTLYAQNPQTVAAWTVANLNALQAGIQLIS